MDFIEESNNGRRYHDAGQALGLVDGYRRVSNTLRTTSCVSSARKGAVSKAQSGGHERSRNDAEER